MCIFANYYIISAFTTKSKITSIYIGKENSICIVSFCDCKV